MIFDPSETHRFRSETNCGSVPGIQFKRRYCKVCGQAKLSENGKFKRGTSRHNPGVFTCFDCFRKGEEND